MPAPNYEQIQSFGRVTDQLIQAAVDEFMEYVYDGMTTAEIIDAAANVAAKYSRLGCELGAQWYDLCTELAGIDAEPAEYGEPDYEQLRGGIEKRIESVSDSSSQQSAINGFLQDLINNSIRDTGSANLWRDYERGLAPGKWARVPVGETCAWCLMLASQGAWYLSEKSALVGNAGKYHDGCDCKAVYHADAESIAGYAELGKYKQMYYDAENMRQNGNYPPDLEARIDKAREQHKAREKERERLAAENGDDFEENPWTKYNETLIIMRYQNGLK